MTKEELKSSLESFFVSKYGLPKNQHLPLNFDLMLSSVISQAIAEHEASQWKKYPENKPENLRNPFLMTDVNGNVIGSVYYDEVFWDAKQVIAFRELPKPYQEDKP